MRASTGEEPADTEEQHECPYFATERGKNPVCLELRLPEGARKALPYSYIMEITFDVAAGIEIWTTQKHIHITGRNLNKLFDYLIAYRVRFIQMHWGTDAAEDGLFVREIRIEPLN